MENPARPGARNTLTLHDVKLDSWVYTMPEDDYVLENVSFHALWVKTEEQG